MRVPLSAPVSPALQQQRRVFWLRTLHQWHWISSAVCLIGMLLFAITGITLNHAAKIEASPEVTHLTATLPAPVVAMLGDHIEMVRQDVPKMLEAVFGIIDSGATDLSIVQIPPIVEKIG